MASKPEVPVPGDRSATLGRGLPSRLHPWWKHGRLYLALLQRALGRGEPAAQATGSALPAAGQTPEGGPPAPAVRPEPATSPTSSATATRGGQAGPATDTEVLVTLPRAATAARVPLRPGLSRLETVEGGSNSLPPSTSNWLDPLVASWRDPDRRPWLAAGVMTLLLLLLLIAAGPWLSGHLAGLGALPAPTGSSPLTGEGAAAEGQLAAQPPPSTLRDLLTPEVALKALPLLLGLFWLLSAWLVDTEARRAFVVQEPWGERRTVAYSCLAMGCIFPLILAGLIFTAYGFVAFVIYVANQRNWVVGIQAGGVILVAGAVLLLVRSIAAGWYADRASS